MPDDNRNGRNEPASIDHDTVVEMNARLRMIETETQGLREWRHDIAAPFMQNLQINQKHIQEAQTRNVESINRLTENVSALASTVSDFKTLPEILHEHAVKDEELFEKMTLSVDQVRGAITNAAEGLSERMSEHRFEGQKGQRQIILWIAAMFIAGLASAVGAIWAIASPHLWH